MSKLLETLKALDRNEMQAFSRYIHSPYFCQHKETIHFFDFLEPYYPKFSIPLYEKYAALYTNHDFPKSRFNVLNSYLLGHLHDFLVQSKLQTQPVLQKALLADSLCQRELYKDAQKQLTLAQRMLEGNTNLDSSNFSDQLKLQEITLDLSFSIDNRSGDVPLQDWYNSLDSHYLGFGLKYLLPAWTLRRLVGFEFPEERWRNIQDMIERDSVKVSVLTRMHYHLLLLLQGRNETSNREQLELLLDQYASRMSEVEMMNVYGYLQNHFTQRMHKGDAEALHHLFKGYQKMVEHNLIFGRAEFSGHSIRNITVIGCRLGELDWTSDFLSTNQTQIEAELGGNAFIYSKAYLDFYLTNYTQALKHLQNLEFIDPFYRTGHQVLLLRIYYELGHFEALEALAGTFRRHLNRTTSLSESQKEQKRKFISILRKLVAAQEKGKTPNRLGKIRSMLSTTEELTDRTWLKAKLLEMEE